MITDVRPLPGNIWLAMCECGLFHPCPDEDAAWEWLTDHVCLEPQAVEAGIQVRVLV